MKKLFAIAIIAQLLAMPFTAAEEKPPLFTWKEILGADNFKTALHKAFPDIKTCALHVNGPSIFAVFRDAKKRRLLDSP